MDDSSLIGKEKVKQWIDIVFNDPLTKIILNNSYLTKIQLETVLIDILSEEISGNKIIKEKKARLRSFKEVSRGSFNRTLKQGQNNITRAIYTILLLGYLGILETPKLSPFLELSSSLETYMHSYKETWSESQTGNVDKQKYEMVSLMRKELENRLSNLLKQKK